jgi:hypothetical protein
VTWSVSGRRAAFAGPDVNTPESLVPHTRISGLTHRNLWC